MDSSFGNETKQVNTNIFGKLNSLGVLKVLNNSIEDEKEQILFEVNPDGITYTKTEQNPTGSDENKNIYNVYVKDNAFFASDVKMSNLNVNALTSDSLETTDVECDEISVNIIDTDKLVSKSSTITELETSGHTSLGNNAVDVNVKEKLVEVNNLLKVNKDLQIGDSVFIHHDQSFNDIDFVKTIIDEQTPKFQLINGTSSYIHNDLDKGSLSSSLFGLWEKPIYTYSSTNWSNADIWHEPNINLSTSFDIPVWERKVENGSFEVPNTFQLSFTSNMSIPFTVSGRNLYAKSIWGNKWSCPKLTGTAVTVTVYKIFKSNNTDSTITSIAKSITINGKDVVENGVIFNKENNLDKKLFDNGSKSRYNYAKSNADSPGDTAVCMLTTSLPASIEFPAAMSDEDGSTLQKVILRVDVNINTYRTRTNNEDGNTFRTYRGLKVLGIIPSSKTSDLNLNTQILARIKDFFKEDGSDQYEMPLEGYEFVGETNAWAKNKAKYYFDKMILPKSYSSKMLNVSSILSNTYVKYEDKTGPIEAHICKDGIGFGNRSLEHVFITTDPIHKKVSLRVFHKDSEDAKLKYVDCNLFDLLLKNKYSEKDYEKDFSKEFE